MAAGAISIPIRATIATRIFLLRQVMPKTVLGGLYCTQGRPWIQDFLDNATAM
jgi:hypothetical protein